MTHPRLPSTCLRQKKIVPGGWASGHIQLQPPQASMGKPSPHGALGIDGGAPAPPLELPPPEPPLDAELLVPLPVVVTVTRTSFGNSRAQVAKNIAGCFSAV